MTDLLHALAGIALALYVGCNTCPRDTYVNGVRPSGVFECCPALGPDDADCSRAPADKRERPRWERECAAQRLDVADDCVRSVIVCTGGARPIWKDARTVGCQR